MKAVKLLLILFILNSSHAQMLQYPQSIPYSGITSYSSRQQDVFSFAANQAALAGISSTSLGIFAERKFMVSEISIYSVAASMPTVLGNFGFQFNYGGFKNYHESRLGMAYARRLGNKIAMGIQFNYSGYRIPSYTIASAINVEAGLIFHLTEQLNAGLHIYNPIGVKLGKGLSEKLSPVYSFGIGYDAAENFYAGIVLIKQEDIPLNITSLIQYNLNRLFYLKGGYSSAGSQAFGGVGFCLKKFRFDIIINYHPQLGVYPGMLLMADVKRTTK